MKYCLHPIHRSGAVCAMISCMLNSCIISTGAHFKNMGEDGQCILTAQRKDESLELYKAQDKTFVKGTLTTFHHYNPELTSSIDLPDRTYKRTTEGAARQTVYKELRLMRYPLPDDGDYREYWQTADSPHITELPQGAKPYHSTVELAPSPSYPNVKDEGEFRQAIITEEISPNLHAIYAYPMSAICRLAIDTPVVVAQGAAFIMALPFLYCYDKMRGRQ